MVSHRQLEAEALLIVEGRGSTVVDADGTEYLDAMAGLWCVNVGFGRTELAVLCHGRSQGEEPRAQWAMTDNGFCGIHALTR